MTDDLLLTVDDVREAGLCVRGAKQWFSLHHLDFKHFLAHGIRASQLPDNDAFAQKVLDVARERRSDE